MHFYAVRYIDTFGFEYTSWVDAYNKAQAYGKMKDFLAAVKLVSIKQLRNV